MKNLGKLIRSALKVGFIGFGGGSALIPVIENELVVGQKTISSDSYLRHTVVANITPGALPVKLGATCGMEMCGSIGSLLGSYLIALPGVALTVLILALFSVLGEGAITYLNYASVGITVFIVYLLCEYTAKVLKGEKLLGKLLFLIAFFVTCGKEVYGAIGHIFGIKIPFSPLLDISMITLIVLSFYMIILSSLTENNILRVCGMCLTAVCAVLYGKKAASVPFMISLRPWVTCLMTILLIVILVSKISTAPKLSKKLSLKKEVLIGVLLLIGIPIIVILIGNLCGLFPKNNGRFLGNVAFSTVTSFGGGESYIAVAESFFVQGGYISEEVFFGRIVPIANALPGPILIKIATACAFVYGQLGGYAGGVALAVTAFLLSIGCCSGIALIIHGLYEELKDTKLLMSIKKSILPIICGSLASTSLSMFNEAVGISAKAGFYPVIVYIVLAVGVAALIAISKRIKVHDMVLLAATIVLSMGCFLIK